MLHVVVNPAGERLCFLDGDGMVSNLAALVRNH